MYRLRSTLGISGSTKAALVAALLAGAPLAFAQRNTFTLPITSTSDTQIHSVKVALPEGYADFPNRKYVAIYLFDSQSDPFFEFVHATLDYLVENGYVQPLILVGVSTANRQFDFTPEAQTKLGKTEFRQSGGTELYYKYVEQDVVASVERKYRCEPFRIGIGHSLGGTFLIHCLLSHRELFNADIVVSPNLAYDESQLVRRVEQANLANRFLYLANGRGDHLEEKFRPATARLVKLLGVGKASGFHFSYQSLANDSHGTTALEGIPKGMIQLYRNFVYPDETFMKQLGGNQAELLANVSRFYAAGSRWSGLTLPMVWDYNNMGYNCYYAGHSTTAIKLFEQALTVYPGDINLYDSLGEVEQLSGNAKMAHKYYTQGLAVVETERAMMSDERYRALLASFKGRLASLAKKQ